MLLVMLSWAIFRFPGAGRAVHRRLFGGGGRLWDGQGVYLLYSSAVLLVLLILKAARAFPEKPPPWQAGSSGPILPCIYRGGARPYPWRGFVLCVAFLVDASYNPFYISAF